MCVWKEMIQWFLLHRIITNTTRVAVNRQIEFPILVVTNTTMAAFVIFNEAPLITAATMYSQRDFIVLLFHHYRNLNLLYTTHTRDVGPPFNQSMK